MADPTDPVGRRAHGAAITAVVEEWSDGDPTEPAPTARALRARIRSRMRTRGARIGWWIERRPTIARALGDLDLVTVVKTMLRPRLAGFRSALGSGPAVGAGGLGRGLDAARRRRRAITPAGFGQDADGRVMVLATVPPLGSRRFRRLVRRAQRAGAVDVDTTGPVEASAILALARAGAPIRLGGPGDAPGEVPASVRSAARTPYDPFDARSRELHSIRLRRAAWASEVATPSVSVLLASRRPDDLTAAVAMVGTQRGVDVQVCVGLHGPGWAADTEDRLREAGVGELVVERFGDDVDLGQVLDGLAARADGHLLSKWDDDDLYGPDHLLDLAIAHHYSAAELVGKAAEFVYLEALDTTVRRYVIGAERPSTTLAGGTLLLARSHLADLGGWPHGPRRVDGLLIDEVLRRGGSVHRTHGFQFILRRRPPSEGGHTWSAPDDYFLVDAVEQRGSLDLGFADIGPGGEDR